MGIIAARSERQAMDWSLVLASQGIENTIERSAETEQWGLSVPRLDYQRAIQAIKQYHVENKRGTWVREVPWSGLLFDWRAATWAVIVVGFFLANGMRDGGLTSAGVMNNALVGQGEWWRLFTAVTLHNDAAHLAVNVTMGFLLIGLAMGGYGPGLGLLVSYLAGAGGNALGLIFYGPEHQSLGASGMVLGALGLITVESIGLRGVALREFVIRGLCGGFLLLVLLGFSADPRTDVLAHVGGFASGAIAGLPLALLRGRTGLKTDYAALFLFAGILLGTWALALK